MKKVFILLFLLMLGMSFNLIAYDQMIVSNQEKAVISGDGSKIHLVRETTVTTVDTIKDYEVSVRAQYYLKDEKITNQLITTGIANPRDSLLPKMTHIFSEDTWVKRQLSIRNSIVVYETLSEYKAKPTYLLGFCLSLIVSIILLFIGYINTPSRTNIIWMLIILSIFLFLGSFETKMTRYDLVIYMGTQLFSAILLFIFNLFDKRKNISKNNLLVKSHIVVKQ